MKKPTSGVIHFINSHPIYNLFRFQRTSDNVCLCLWGSVLNAVILLSMPLILLGAYFIVGDLVFGIEASIPDWIIASKVLVIPLSIGMVAGMAAGTLVIGLLVLVFVVGILRALDKIFDFNNMKIPDITKVCPKFKEGDNE